MNKQEMLEKQYESKKRAFEEKKEELFFKRDKGIQDLEEIADSTQYYLKDYMPDQELLFQALTGLDNMKEEVLEAAQFDQKKLEKEWADVEEDYYRELRKLSDKTSSKKEGDI